MLDVSSVFDQERGLNNAGNGRGVMYSAFKVQLLKMPKDTRHERPVPCT